MRFLTHFQLVIAAIALAPIAATPEPLSAQTSEAVYEDLVDAINEGVDPELMLDSTMRAVRDQYAAVPGMAAAEEMSPGLIDELIKEQRPIFRDYQQRVTDMYRPQMVNLFAEAFTPSEARSVAEFYRSDIGRRITNGVSRNFSPDATLEDIANFEDATDAEIRERVEQDMSSAAIAAVSELSSADMAEMGRLALENPALLKMTTISSNLVAIRARMEQELPTPAENARIEAATESVFERRLGK